MDSLVVMEKIKSTIVGRNKYIKEINGLFDKVLDGDFSTVIIRGESGVGKTFLVNHIINSLQNGHITFVHGKYKQNTKVPYVALSEIVDGIFENILTLSATQYNLIQNKLELELGADLDFIYNISPLAKKVFKNYKYQGDKSYTKSKYRIKRTVERFFGCISETFFPLIIFVDDLQWADTTTLDILFSLSSGKSTNMMLVLASRTNYIDKELEKLEQKAKVIELTPLNEMDINDLVHKVFGTDLDNTTYLGRIIYSLTLGNPFYVKKMIEMFYDKGVLIYHEYTDVWVSDINKINSIELPSNIKQMMEAKIELLNDSEKSLLEYIACLDGLATYEQIELVLSSKLDNIEQIIERLCEQSFIIENDRASYKIVHDIILELIYNNIDDARKMSIHYDIAKAIIQSNASDNMDLAFISSQLIRSDYTKWKKQEKQGWAVLLFEEGKNVIDIAAYDKGIVIFTLCQKLLMHVQNQNNDFMIDVLLRLAKCHYYSGDFNETEKIFAELLESYKERQDVVKIKLDYIQMLAFKGEDKAVLEIGVEILSLLDYSFNIADFDKDLSELMVLYNDDFIENLSGNKRLSSNHYINILQTLNRMMTSAQILGEMEFMYILIKIAIISANQGYSDYSLIGYQCSAYVFYHIVGRYDKAKKISDYIKNNIESIKDERIKAKVLGFYATFIHHWSNPLSKTIELLEYANDMCLEIGEVIYAEYTLASLMFALGVSSANLDYFKSKIKYRIESLNNITNKQFTIKYIYESLSDYFDYMVDGESQSVNIEKSANEVYDASSLVYLWFYLQSSYLSDAIDNVYSVMELFQNHLDKAKGHIIYPEVVFYSLLVRLQHHDSLDINSKEENITYIESLRAFLENVCENYSDNHNTRLLIINGLYDAVLGEGKTTASLYNKAIKLAEEKSNWHLAAIGNLLATDFYKEHIKLSEFYIDEAIHCFEKWGAKHIARLIKGNQDKVDVIPIRKQPCKNIDKEISLFIKDIENMEEEDAFSYMLEKVIDVAGCEYSAVLFEQSDDMYVCYEKHVDKKVIRYTKPLIVNYKDDVSKKIIRYVARTGETVSLTEKPQNGLFALDKYIMTKSGLSVVCTPFYYFNILIGVIYLESSTDNSIDVDTVSFINGIVPTLMAKCKKIKDVNISDFLSPEKSISPLTERETDILELVAQGLSNCDISKKVYISTGTVKTHLSSIYNKLDVDSRIKAVVKGKEMNIL